MAGQDGKHGGDKLRGCCSVVQVSENSGLEKSNGSDNGESESRHRSIGHGDGLDISD